MTQRTQSPPRRRKSAVVTTSGTAKPSAEALGSEPHTAVPDEAARREMIAIAAYFRAEHRGFAPGDPLDDWLSAEAEITQMFAR